MNGKSPMKHAFYVEQAKKELLLEKGTSFSTLSRFT